MTSLSILNAGKLEKAMKRLYDFGDKIMSLEDFFKYNPPLYKKVYIQEFSKKRIHLEYKQVKPVKKYYVFYTENRCIEVPKLYYDTLTDIPEHN